MVSIDAYNFYNLLTETFLKFILESIIMVGNFLNMFGKLIFVCFEENKID
jgi:hypothetical protein